MTKKKNTTTYEVDCLKSELINKNVDQLPTYKNLSSYNTKKFKRASHTNQACVRKSKHHWTNSDQLFLSKQYKYSKPSVVDISPSSSKYKMAKYYKKSNNSSNVSPHRYSINQPHSQTSQPSQTW